MKGVVKVNDNELIMFILLNSAKKESIVETILSCFMDEKEASTKFEVSVPTINAWYKMGKLKGYKVGETILFLRSAKDPRNTD